MTLNNDALIEKYQDNILEYDRLKLGYDGKNVTSTIYPKLNIKSEIISLYNGGLFLEELLNNSYSLNQLKSNENMYINI